MRFDLPVTVTPSRVEGAARCFRKYLVQEVIGYRKSYSPPLEFGSVIHAGVGQWWQTRDQSLAFKALRDEWEQRFENPLKYVDQKYVSLRLAERMLEGYFALATLAGPGAEEDDWQVVSVEERFPVKLGQHTITLQLDRTLYNRKLEKIRIVDTKTAAKLDKRWAKSWDLSLQMMLYKSNVKKMFDLPVEVVVEGVLKEPNTEIQYVMLPDWTEEQLLEADWMAERIANEQAGMILEAQERGLDPVEYLLMFSRYNPGNCQSYGSECQYFSLCTASPEMRKALLEAEFKPIETEEY